VNVWSLGDAALVPDVRRGEYCPPTAQYAMRQGRHCARNVLSTVGGRGLRRFEYGGLGQLAVVGRRCGVAQVLGWRIAGLPAWWLWRTVYFMKLPGLRCKIRVGLDWALDLIFPRDITKLAVERTERLRRSHFQAGDIIIRQGELGNRFYVIESGEVEILREEPSLPLQRLATRSAGESFGEVALLRDTPRTATVRCLTAVNVISFTRGDFRSLVASHKVFRTQVECDLRERTSAPEGSASSSASAH
jgi:NADH dehydrogenase